MIESFEPNRNSHLFETWLGYQERQKEACQNVPTQQKMLEVDVSRLVVWRLRTGFSIRLAFRPTPTNALTTS
jgi:hypothetical protein